MAQISQPAKSYEDRIAELEGQIKELKAAQAPKARRFYEKRPQRFYTLIDRYVHGKYVRSSPAQPAVVTFDDDIKIEVDESGLPVDKTLVPYEKGAPAPKAEKLAPPYAAVRRGHKDRTDEGSGRPADEDPGQ